LKDSGTERLQDTKAFIGRVDFIVQHFCGL
jgi:hypothetical protein